MLFTKILMVNVLLVDCGQLYDEFAFHIWKVVIVPVGTDSVSAAIKTLARVVSEF